MLRYTPPTTRKPPFRLFCFTLTLFAAPAAKAGESLSTGPDCGPDAFSSAQVIEHRPPRRGPLTAMPDTLCTDLTPQQPQPRIDILVTPGLGAPAGASGSGIPYEGRPQRFPSSR